MMKPEDLIKQPKVKIALAIVIIALLSFFFFKFAYALWKENNDIKEKIQRDQNEITRAKSIVTQQQSLSEVLKKLNSDIKLAQEKFFLNSEGVFSRLNRFAQESSISLRSINPGERTRVDIPNKKDIYLELLYLNIKLTCDFNQLLAFLKDIEGSEQVIAVNDIKILIDPQDVWNHNIDVELKVPLLINTKTNEQA